MPTSTKLTPYFPPEWASHQAVWLAWPCAKDLWEENLSPAQNEFIALCRAIRENQGERLKILVYDEQARLSAERHLAGLAAQFFVVPYGDIWLRDTAPIFLEKNGQIEANVFRFNGWGGKYKLPHDPELAAKIAVLSGFNSLQRNYVLEGGSLDVDGNVALTTRQCLLNPNRNSHLSQSELEDRLIADFGLKKVLWLKSGLINDHTDGHIDTIARFVGPSEVVCMRPANSNDPNKSTLEEIEADLRQMRDHEDRPLKVHCIPSPGAIYDEDDQLMPASYVNFYIGNHCVAVPTYGSSNDAEAILQLQKLFPGRKVSGLSARAILSGGGAFHCISQQEPLVANHLGGMP